MIKINIHEAKTHLSRYLAKLRAGERILLCRRNQPIAEIVGLPALDSKKRPVGLAKGRLTIPAAFSEPLPEEVLQAFERGA